MKFLLILLTFLATPAIAYAPQESLPVPVPVAATAAVASDSDQISVRRCLVGVGDYQEVDGLLLVSKDATPTLANVGHLMLTGQFDTASVLADDANRDPVPVSKVSDREWLIKGSGRVIVVATLATREPFGIEQRRYDIDIKSLSPVDPVVPDPVVPEPVVPNIEPDQFDNIGQRVAKLAAGLPERKAVADCYRKYAKQLELSVEAAQISSAMVTERSQIVAQNEQAWQPALSMVANDFNTRRPTMLRSDVVDHWLAIAKGLDPQ